MSHCRVVPFSSAGLHHVGTGILVGAFSTGDADHFQGPSDKKVLLSMVQGSRGTGDLFRLWDLNASSHIYHTPDAHQVFVHFPASRLNFQQLCFQSTQDPKMWYELRI